MPFPTDSESRYRPCVGVALFNSDGLIWMGKRIGAKGFVWQLPQGGIDAGEAPHTAAIRELQEETGVVASLTSPLGGIDDWLYYDIPATPVSKDKKKRDVWRGQKQKWYAMRYHGTNADIDLTYHLPAEFSDFHWAKLSDISELVVPFKRNVYERLQSEFEVYARGAN